MPLSLFLPPPLARAPSLSAPGSTARSFAANRDSIFSKRAMLDSLQYITGGYRLRRGCGRPLSIVILISTLEFARTIRPFMQMRAHAPPAIAVFNGARYETRRCTALAGTCMNIDVNPELRHARSCRSLHCCYSDARALSLTHAPAAQHYDTRHARLVSSKPRFRLYCLARASAYRGSRGHPPFPPGVIASLSAQIIRRRSAIPLFAARR